MLSVRVLSLVFIFFSSVLWKANTTQKEEEEEQDTKRKAQHVQIKKRKRKLHRRVQN